MLDATLNIISCGLIFSLVGLGIFLSNRVLRVIDLTCESSFALGGCMYGTLVMTGAHPIVALLISAILGYVAGLMTATLAPLMKQNIIIASILSVSVIDSFLCKILQGESKQIMVQDILHQMSETQNFITILVISGLCLLIFYKMLTSEYGLAMRARGDGILVSESLGIPSSQPMRQGLALENLMCALAGALLVQLSGKFSSGMGSGCLIFGIVASILGERLFDAKGFRCAIIGAFVAAAIYQIVLKCLMIQNVYGLGEEYRGVILAATLFFVFEVKENASNNNDNAAPITT